MRSRMHRDKLRLARVTGTRADADSSKDLYEAAFVQTLGMGDTSNRTCNLQLDNDFMRRCWHFHGYAQYESR